MNDVLMLRLFILPKSLPERYQPGISLLDYSPLGHPLWSGPIFLLGVFIKHILCLIKTGEYCLAIPSQNQLEYNFLEFMERF